MVLITQFYGYINGEVVDLWVWLKTKQDKPFTMNGGTDTIHEFKKKKNHSVWEVTFVSNSFQGSAPLPSCAHLQVSVHANLSESRLVFKRKRKEEINYSQQLWSLIYVTIYQPFGCSCQHNVFNKTTFIAIIR